MAMMI